MSDAENRLLQLAREKRAARDEVSQQQLAAFRRAQEVQRRADAASLAEERRVRERVRIEQAAFLDLMRQAGNPGLGRFPGRVMFVQLRGWKFGDHLLDRKGRWWRFRPSISATGELARHYAEQLPAPPPISSEQFAEVLARHGVA